MPSNRSHRHRRERQQVERRRAAREPAARETQRQQEIAASRRDWRRRRQRHGTAYALFALAAVIGVGHFFEHAGTIQLMSTAMQDLFLGWPMSILLAIIGAIVWGT